MCLGISNGTRDVAGGLRGGGVWWERARKWHDVGHKTPLCSCAPLRTIPPLSGLAGAEHH